MSSLPNGFVVRGKDDTSYEILKLAGKGSFGITYEARLKTKPWRRVALKECFPDEFCKRGDDGVRVHHIAKLQYLKALIGFNKELTALEKLSSSGVARVQEYFHNGTTRSLFMVMDWIPNGTLKEKIKEGGVSPADACVWLKRLLKTLKQVHACNIFHRDIKPANIMFNDLDEPVIVDFGVALDRDNKEGRTMLGVGTPGYCAPEQFCSAMGRVRAWSDLYSLAATWYELLTGHQYDYEETAQAKQRLASVEVDERFKNALIKNLSSEPRERCQTADEWLALLEEPMEIAERQPEPNPPSEGGNSPVGTVGSFIAEHAKRIPDAAIEKVKKTVQDELARTTEEKWSQNPAEAAGQVMEGLGKLVESAGDEWGRIVRGLFGGNTDK